jgi:hypothetical protein
MGLKPDGGEKLGDTLTRDDVEALKRIALKRADLIDEMTKELRRGNEAGALLLARALCNVPITGDVQ